MIEYFDRRFLAKLFSGHPRTLRLFPSHSRKRELLGSYVIAVLLSLSAERTLRVPCFYLSYFIGKLVSINLLDVLIVS